MDEEPKFPTLESFPSLEAPIDEEPIGDNLPMPELESPLEQEQAEAELPEIPEEAEDWEKRRYIDEHWDEINAAGVDEFTEKNFGSVEAPEEPQQAETEEIEQPELDLSEDSPAAEQYVSTAELKDQLYRQVFEIDEEKANEMIANDIAWSLGLGDDAREHLLEQMQEMNLDGKSEVAKYVEIALKRPDIAIKFFVTAWRKGMLTDVLERMAPMLEAEGYTEYAKLIKQINGLKSFSALSSLMLRSTELAGIQDEAELEQRLQTRILEKQESIKSFLDISAEQSQLEFTRENFSKLLESVILLAEIVSAEIGTEIEIPELPETKEGFLLLYEYFEKLSQFVLGEIDSGAVTNFLSARQ